MKTFSSLIFLSTFGITFAGETSQSAFISPLRSFRGWSLSSISIGPTWRSFGSLNYRGRSRSQNLLIPSQIGGDFLSLPSIGSSSSIDDRTYTNGFVNQDGSTSTNGDTWFWGYNSGAQVSGDTLSFNATGNRSIYSETNSFGGDFIDRRRLESISPQIDFLLRPPSTLTVPFDGLLVSFWYFGDDSSNKFSNFSTHQHRDNYRIDLTDRYDISAITPLISAPYTGSITGPGPLISNLPTDRERLDILIGNENADFSNSISTSLNLNGYSLSIGPTIRGNISEKWAWQASAGITLNVFKWSARETETLNLSLNGAPSTIFQQWQSSKSGTDFRLGIYFKGEVIHDISQDWFAKASLQAEMAGSIDMNVGNSEYEFKPRGYSFGLSLGRVF